MAFLRALLFAVVFYTGSILYVLLAVPAALMQRSVLQHFVTGWAKFHHRCNRLLLGIDYRIEGEIPKGPYLFASKHQSMYETLALILILHEPAIVFKKELADIPIWGWVAKRYGTIPVDRNGSAQALRSVMRAAEAEVADGRPIVIFPEGTRVRPGEQPQPRAGFAGLYKMLKLPVIPIATDSGHFWLRKRFIKKPGIVTFRFGDPIEPGLPRADAEARVHAGINALEVRSTPE